MELLRTVRVAGVDKPFHSLPIRNLSPAVHFFLTVSDFINSILSTLDFHFPQENNSPQLCLQPWTIRIYHSFRYSKLKLKNKMHPDTGDLDRSSAELALWKDGFSAFIFTEEYDLFLQAKQPTEQSCFKTVIHIISDMSFNLLPV